jgi:hypothetical protein
LTRGLGPERSRILSFIQVVQHADPDINSHNKPLSILAPILRVIFAIPAASSKSEQVFSVAGRVVTLD